jgi:uncharacterized membrane protein YfcA
MGIGEILAIALAGLAAGTVNTVVGSGTLITFPVLLAFGYSPVTANVSNSVGLVPGSVSGAIGYRAELAGQRRRAIRLGACSVAGGLLGAVLLLVLPASAFKAIVPVFIAAALVLVVLQPRISARLERRSAGKGHEHSVLTPLAIFGTGIYCGYFGAAQGVLLLGILGVALPQDLHRTNALKNVLAGLGNGVAGLYFALVADVAWAPAALIAAGSIVGGQLGAKYGRRLTPAALRALIVVVGTTAIVRLVAG